MAIVRWDPFGEIMSMQREMDRIFSRMGMAQQQGETQAGTTQQAWMPKLDIKQVGEDMQIRAELAGVRPEDVDLEVTEGVLTLKGERRAEEEREDQGWLVRETSYGSFQRSVALPEGIDASQVRADYHDGILEVTVPKAFAQAEPRTTRIAISGTGQQQDQLEGQHGSQGQQGRQQAQGQQGQQPARQEDTEGPHEGVVS